MAFGTEQKIVFGYFEFGNLSAIHAEVWGRQLCLSKESGEVTQAINLRIIQSKLFACKSVHVRIMSYSSLKSHTTQEWLAYTGGDSLTFIGHVDIAIKNKLRINFVVMTIVCLYLPLVRTHMHTHTHAQ